ncbi:CMP-sialic acid transporter 1 [Cucurbita argyrosperma subsp. argyrosperma]|nr:CMP-sialic acid transporter 1 [Cucurbita argyrosperma subsp. argyrosperma]
MRFSFVTSSRFLAITLWNSSLSPSPRFLSSLISVAAQIARNAVVHGRFASYRTHQFSEILIVLLSYGVVASIDIGILTTLSQSNGRYEYDYATVPFLAEVFKLLVSSMFLWKESQKSPPPKMTTDWRTVRLYPIPSIIYLIHNNVQFATLTYVDTSTYQIMGNLKIVTTGILFR